MGISRHLDGKPHIVAGVFLCLLFAAPSWGGVRFYPVCVVDGEAFPATCEYSPPEPHTAGVMHITKLENGITEMRRSDGRLIVECWCTEEKPRTTITMEEPGDTRQGERRKQ